MTPLCAHGFELQGLDLALQDALEFEACLGKILRSLQVEPELRRSAEVTRQAQRGIG